MFVKMDKLGEIQEGTPIRIYVHVKCALTDGNLPLTSYVDCTFKKLNGIVMYFEVNGNSHCLYLDEIERVRLLEQSPIALQAYDVSIRYGNLKTRIITKPSESGEYYRVTDVDIVIDDLNTTISKLSKGD